MTANRFEYTDHALDRFIKRHATALTFNQARDYLAQLVEEGAAPLKTKTRGGQTVYRIGREGGRGLHLVTKPDDGKHIVVTVLPADATGFEDDEGEDSEIEREMIEAFERVKQMVDKKATNKQIDAEIASRTARARRVLEAKINGLRKIRDDLRADIRRELSGGPSEAVANTPAVNPLRRIVADLERKLDRQAVHADRMSRERLLAQNCLTILVRAALGDGGPRSAVALGRIVKACPDFLKPTFYDRDVQLQPAEHADTSVNGDTSARTEVSA